MLDDKLLENYIHNFFGHGNLDSNFWFISIEEGGGNTEKELQNRLTVWKKRGCKQVEDCKSFHLEFGKGDWFGEPTKYQLIGNKPQKVSIQSTWKMYIRLFFYASNNRKFIESKEQNEIIRRYQRDNFGKSNGDMCIMELRPLPSKNLSTWLYKDFSNLPFLKSKERYEEYVDNFRIKDLKNKIEKYKPKFIIFLSRSKIMVPIWSKIISETIKENPELGFLYARKNDTYYFITEHAVAKSYIKNGQRVMGLGNDYFNKIGEFISRIN